MNEPNFSKLWDNLAEITGKDRHACKHVIYAMLFGANIVEVMCKYNLELEDVVDMRMAFNHYTSRPQDREKVEAT